MIGRPNVQFSGGCFCLSLDAGPARPQPAASVDAGRRVAGRQLLERQQSQRLGVAGIDHVDAGDVESRRSGRPGCWSPYPRTSADRARSGPACGPDRRPCPRSARTSTSDRRPSLGVKSTSGSPGSFSRSDEISSSSCGLAGSWREYDFSPKRPVTIMTSSVLVAVAVPSVAVLEEVDRGGPLALRDRLDQLNVLRCPDPPPARRTPATPPAPRTPPSHSHGSLLRKMVFEAPDATPIALTANSAASHE